MPASVPVVSSAVAAAEQRMRTLLAQGKWRQARNDLKALLKTDRARFLPLLVEANLGLARQMLSAGQDAQARQVFAYLATLVPPEQLRAFEAGLAGTAGTAGHSGPPPGESIAALADSSVARSEPERMRLADQVVLAFEPVSAAEPAQARLADEARAIHEALHAWSRREWSAVSEILRRVPHRSPFSHWVIFVKGIMGFHTGEAERAAKLLQGLPAGSAPAKAAQAYLWLLARAAGGEPASPAESSAPTAEATQAAVCRLIGAGDVSAVLIRADRHWRGGKHVESYRAVRDDLGPFPSAGLDWPGVLSEFYFKAPHGMAEAEWVKFLRFFADLIGRDRLKNEAERMLAHRLSSLMGQAIAPPDELRAGWEAFLRVHQAVHGANPHLASLGYGWLGERLSMVCRSRGFFAGPPQMRDPGGAVEMLRRSIELDPANLAAHLKLCDVYGALKKHSERNRLLDEMTARFADEKHVLVRAAEGCIERKAFGKGLGYLARARQLDQLDPRIPELTVAGLCAQARQQFQQRRPEKAQQTLAQAEPWLTDKPDDFRRGRWTVLVRHGLMERRWANPEQAEALLARARALAPHPAAMLLFAHLTDRENSKPYFGETGFLEELKATLRGAPRLAEIGWLLRLLEQWQDENGETRMHFEEKVIREAIPRALSQPFTRAEAAEVIERARDRADFARPLQQLVKKLLRADSLDPQARLWRLDLSGPWNSEPAKDRAELQSIVDEATRRRDDPSLRKARQMLRDLDLPPPMPNPFGPELAGPELDDEEDDHEEDDFEHGGGPLPDLPPEMEEEFAELLEAMRVAPESALRDLRKTAQRQGVPDFIFDTLIAAAKGKPLPVPPSGPPKFSPPAPKPLPPSAPMSKPAAPKPPVSDPDQLNLF